MGKNLKLDQITKLFEPVPGEVYLIPNDKVVYDTSKKSKDADKSRPILVVTSQSLLADKRFPLLNIIPLTTDGTPDNLCFPIAKKYSEISKGYKLSINSLALLPYYQPIDKDHLISLCGKIDSECYNGIVSALCMKVIGYDDYDLNVD